MIDELQRFSMITSTTVQDLVLKIPDALNHHSLKNKEPVVNVISKY